MIRSSLVIGTLITVAAAASFVVGCYVGWQTTLRVLDSALARRRVSKE